MRLWDGEGWGRDVLDWHSGSGEVRVRPHRWLTLGEVSDLWIEQERSFRRALDYARQLGVKRTARKIVSRFREEERRNLFCACGIGTIDGSDASVVWFAPRAPNGAERVVVPRAFVRPLESAGGVDGARDRFAYARWEGARFWDEFAGWSRFSGAELPPHEEVMKDVVAALGEVSWGEGVELPRTPVCERRSARIEEPAGSREVTLFGWGHHARTQLVPMLPDPWTIRAVHEIDPRLHGDATWGWDSAPHLRDSEPVDVVAIAGYHATHAPLAVEALSRGADVVVEKPAVTTPEQLDELGEAMRGRPSLHVLYHKRYGAIADYLREDLSPPIDMHAIVYEIPLPARHWYHWPSSGGRITSNGCHWIDQFLGLNPGASVSRLSAESGPSGQIHATIDLDNGAAFSLALSERGSSRRGTRELVEFRSAGRTARVIDASHYVCEDAHGEVRRAEEHPLDALECAYGAVFEAIERGERGDSPDTVVRTHSAVLRLAAMLDGSP